MSDFSIKICGKESSNTVEESDGACTSTPISSDPPLINAKPGDERPDMLMEKSEFTQARKDLAIYWHEACVEHNVPRHPEKPGRVTAILNALRENYTPDYFREAPLVTDDQILLYHTAEHLEQFKQLCDAAERAKCEKDKSDSSLQADSELYQYIDGDTVVMWRTHEAAYRAAGSIVAAIDSIYLPADHPERIK